MTFPGNGKRQKISGVMLEWSTWYPWMLMNNVWKRLIDGGVVDDDCRITKRISAGKGP